MKRFLLHAFIAVALITLVDQSAELLFSVDLPALPVGIFAVIMLLVAGGD